MNEREQNLKIISNEFANWEVRVGNLNSINLYDANTISENSICDLLNTIFDYNLVNVNKTTKNHAAIDLGDETNRISYQITSTKSSQKIQKSLDTFFGNNLNLQYDQLFVFILGKKQKKYPDFKCRSDFSFNAKRHVLDFRDLLDFVCFLPNKKIKKILKVLLEQNSVPNKIRAVSNGTQIKRNLALKKKLKKDLLVELDRQDWKRAMFEPYIRFKYHNIIIRCAENDTFPKGTETEGKMSSWFKGEFWDFYDNGIELIGHGGKAIIDKDGYWDLLDWKEDLRESNPKYKTVSCHEFHRIPYSYIVELDMDTDPYYGLPALYVHYAKDGMPYEELLFGFSGNFKLERLTHYLDNEMRKSLD